MLVLLLIYASTFMFQQRKLKQKILLDQSPESRQLNVQLSSTGSEVTNNKEVHNTNRKARVHKISWSHHANFDPDESGDDLPSENSLRFPRLSDLSTENQVHKNYLLVKILF